MTKEPWERFFDEMPYEIIMGSTPTNLLRMFYKWLEENGYIAETEWVNSLTEK